MVSEINIDDALSLNWPVIDVRSPGEFEHGHIPGAVNIPLFSNEERARVGTLYKQKSREAAMEAGLKFVRPKLGQFITDSFGAAPEAKAIVHCWRGGMRSESFASHLDDNGFREVKRIKGGYKAFRNHVLDCLGIPLKLRVLGGYTGSGKTPILKELKKMGEQVIDLEALAKHKGSAFGGIEQDEQPTVEQFENNLFEAWSALDRNRRVWVEDESHNIGGALIPMPFFNQMREAQLYFVDIPKEERARHLVSEYAGFDDRKLAASIQRISKRLGGLREKQAMEHLQNGNYFEVAMIALQYYDKSYLRGMKRRDKHKVLRIPLPSTCHKENAIQIHKTVLNDE